MIEFYSDWCILLCLCAAFIICFTSIPAIVEISKVKKLFADENNRSSHVVPTPSLGGLAIFVAVLICTPLFTIGHVSPTIKYTLVAVTLMFAIGLKDDILVIAPRKKFMIQFLAAFILVVFGDIRVSNFFGVFGLNEISYISSVLFSIFVIVLITNALNLIDGIDGLSSSLTIIMSSFFGIWFFLIGRMDLVILAAALVGSLAAFFYHNVYSRKTKIFMGDTGSLILGMILAVFAIKFNELNIESISQYAFSTAPVVAFGVLVIPLFDTLRVFLTRMKRGKSPFSPDKNHVHHMLLSLGFSHKLASLFLAFVNLSFILLVVYLREMEINSLLLVVLAYAFCGTYALALKSGHHKSYLLRLLRRRK